jgi:hypothetical protein
LNKLARESGFVQRASALDGYNFFLAMTLGSLSSVNQSLCSLLGSVSDVVTRSALHQRIDESAVLLMKMILERMLKEIAQNRCSLSSGVFRKFSRVLVWDGSSWSVNESLKHIFKGNGGDASDAAVMLQYAYDVKSSVLEFFKIAPGSQNDQHFRCDIESTVQRRDLLLIDRGYFSAKLFKAIGESMAYYISRLKVGPLLYLEEKNIYQKLDICRLLRHHKTQLMFEFEAFLGNEKIPVRIICARIDDKKANEKIRKLKKEAKSRGKQVSKQRLAHARWGIFITNVEKEKLAAAEVAEMYRVRWNVELVFKQLKSTFHIDKVNHKNEHRLQCEIYAKLIMAAIVQHIHGVAQLQSWKTTKKEISIDKLFKHVKQNAQFLLRAVTYGRKYLSHHITEFYNAIFKRCIKFKQPSRQTTFEKLLKPRKKIKALNIRKRKLTVFAYS